jgi:hypothetical protein
VIVLKLILFQTTAERQIAVCLQNELLKKKSSCSFVFAHYSTIQHLFLLLTIIAPHVLIRWSWSRYMPGEGNIAPGPVKAWRRKIPDFIVDLSYSGEPNSFAYG